MDIQRIISNLMMRQNRMGSLEKEDKEIFKYNEIELPKKLSKLENDIFSSLINLCKCKQCFELESNQAKKLCQLCIETVKQLEKIIFSGIFENDNYIPLLSAFWKTGNNIKVYCGKILKANDLGFKCYDCEMDPTCIICKECFEKGNHIGHRTVVQKGCSGCCDCGDIEAWKKEGFCSDHKGFLTNEQLSLEQINKKQRDNCIEAFKFLFYFLISQIENLLKQTQKGQQIQELSKNLSIQRIAEYIIMLIEKLVLKNAVLQNLFNHILCEQHFEENRFKFRHCCPDIISRIKIGSNDSHPLQKCQCNILELLLRYICAFASDVQEKIKNLFISMFNLYHFKQNLIKSYTKMFNFFYYFKDIKDEKESHPFITNFVDLNVQLFTSDILAAYVLDQKTESYIIEYFMAQNNNQLRRKGSLDLQEKIKKQFQGKNNKEIEEKRKQSDIIFDKKSKSRKNSDKLVDQEKKAQTSNNQDIQVDEKEEQEEIKNQNQIELEEFGIIQPELEQNNEENSEDFVDVDDNEDIDEDEDVMYEEDDDEEDDNDDDNEQDVSASDQYHLDYHEDEMDDSLPLFDQKIGNADFSGLNCLNEYYFGNILDRLLQFSCYSFKQRSVLTQFLHTFQHLKYISQKDFSLSRLIEKELFRTKFVEILSKLHHKIDSKLRRKFETIYQESEYAFNGLDCEKALLSILRKIISYLHTSKSVDEALFLKVHVDYLKLIMKKILQTTEKIDTKQICDISSVHIPLHRALTLFIMSYFKFDFESITNHTINQLARHLNIDYDQFKNFFAEQLKYPLNVISFIKHPSQQNIIYHQLIVILVFVANLEFKKTQEIDCGVWNNHGEEFRYLSDGYISLDLGFQYYDTLFVQFALRIGQTDLKQLINIFSNKKEFQDIVNFKIIKNIKQDQKDFIEKNEKVVGEFFSFMIYSLIDTVSLYNLVQSLFHKSPLKLNPYMKYSNIFIASYMHQFQQVNTNL